MSAKIHIKIGSQDNLQPLSVMNCTDPGEMKSPPFYMEKLNR